jgi:hypothetical protein
MSTRILNYIVRCPKYGDCKVRISSDLTEVIKRFIEGGEHRENIKIFRIIEEEIILP